MGEHFRRWGALSSTVQERGGVRVYRLDRLIRD